MADFGPPPTTTPMTAPGNGRAMHPWILWFGIAYDHLKAVIAETTKVVANFLVEHNPNGTHATIHASGPIFERGRATAMGDWIPVPFNAANFSAFGGGTWVVTAQATYAYKLEGTTMTLSVSTDNATIAGVVTILQVVIPGGFLAAKQMGGVHWWFGAGAEMGLAWVVPGSAVVLLYRPNLGAYPAGVARHAFTFEFEVQP